METSNIYRENSFFQAAQNVKKVGSYYTDVGHCRRIHQLFDFSAAEEICVLEPSIGDGSAVLAVTGGAPNCKIYGVEIQKETYREHLQENENLAYVLNEDFLRGVKISHGVFSFCFSNPPYGTSQEDGTGKRLEALFLEKIGTYMKCGGYLVLVIPFPVFKEEKFFRLVMTRFEICHAYRFDDKEYDKFHQICVILKKKRGSMTGYLRSLFEEKYQLYGNLENYPYLPEEGDEPEERYTVPESRDADISYFTTTNFDPYAAMKNLDASPLYDAVKEEVFQKPYKGCDLNQPIVPVSNDIAYLLAVTGGGQGLAGNKEERTLHLQRGVAKRVVEDELREKEGVGETSSSIIVTTTYTKIRLNVVENDGTITQL